MTLLTTTTPTTYPNRCSLQLTRRVGLHVALVVIAVVSLQSAPSSEARTRHCPTHRGGLYQVIAHNMSCATALRLISRVRYRGPAGRTPRLSGWWCKRISVYPEGATFQCNRRAQAFRWTAGG